jgi:hypothetical protein
MFETMTFLFRHAVQFTARRFALALFILNVSLVSSATGQEATEDSTVSDWEFSLEGRISGSQTRFTNWKEGGVNTLGYSAEIKGQAVQTTEAWKQTHKLRLAFGQVKQGELATRKSTDVVQYGFVLQNLGTSPLNPTIALEFRTQFASGFNYRKNPFKDGRDPPVRVSDAMSPGYILQSLGLSYDPDNWFSTRLGVAGKHTIMNDISLGTLYGIDPGMHTRFELGIESHTDVEVGLVENVLWESRFGLFAAFNKKELPDARWENFLTMTINDWLNVKAEHVILFDKDVSTKIQSKQIISLGISITIL